jgi:hypothetical protein
VKVLDVNLVEAIGSSETSVNTEYQQFQLDCWDSMLFSFRTSLSILHMYELHLTEHKTPTLNPACVLSSENSIDNKGWMTTLVTLNHRIRDKD